MSDNKTIYAMNVNYVENEDGHFEGSFTLTSDNNQWIELMKDVSGKGSKLRKYKSITLKTPDSTHYLTDAYLTGYNDSISMSKDYSTPTFKFVCNKLV